MDVLVIRKNEEVRSKMKALVWSQDFPDYNPMGAKIVNRAVQFPLKILMFLCFCLQAYPTVRLSCHGDICKKIHNSLWLQ